ncbi:hypothetical protein BDZ89DRAFT_1017475 [Hymenopellis radicata]|nr:hypothetical protein BDZ89DRAFT_1017475 [Hymenopellis radicata]
MRFPLFRRLSHLIHRRAKSEPLTGIGVEPLDALTRSYSLSNIGEQARPSSFEPSVTQIMIPPPHALNTPPGSPTFIYPTDVTTLSQRILELEHQLGQLKVENSQLKDANNALKFDTELLQEQLSFLENAERPLSSDVRLITKEALEILKTQARRCIEMDRFVRTVISLGLQTEEPIFPRVHKAIIAGETHDEALVDAIRDAAAKPGTPWVTIIPAVIGPRTNEQYLSAINMTLQSRKENRELQGVKKFWKNVAKEDPANADLVTPSSSNLSAVQAVLSEKRQQAVDDLLAQLRNGSVPIRSQIVSQSAVKSSDMPRPESVVLSASMDSTKLLGGNATVPHTEPGVVVSSSDSSTVLPYLRDDSLASLPALASQTFKQELKASHSRERFSISTTYKHALAPRDLNLPSIPEKPIEPAYTLPEFPHDFSGSSDLGFFGPSASSAVSSSNGSSKHVERGSLSALEEEESVESDAEADIDIPDVTLVNDSVTVDAAKSLSPTKKSLLPVRVMNSSRQNSFILESPTKARPVRSPSKLPLSPRKVTRPPTPPTKATRAASALKYPSSPSRLQPPSSPSLRKPSISSMKKTTPGTPVKGAMKETSPLRIRKKEKRMSPMRRLSRMVLG